MSRILFAALAAAAALVAQLAIADGAAAQTVIRQTTARGLPFRYVHMPNASHQSLYFAWRDGTSVAAPGKEAVPVLGVALMMEGPQGMSRSALIEELRDLQANVGLSASSSLAQGHITAPRAKFATAAHLYARVLSEPAMPAQRLAELKRNAMDAVRQGEGNTETMAQRLFSCLLIADETHRRYLTGYPDIYSQVTLDEIEAWRRNILVRSGLALVAVGPMGAGELGVEIDRLFASLPQTGQAPALPKPTLRAPGKLVVLERPAVQTAIVAGGPMNVAITPDLTRTQLAISVLGGGASSRLWLAVREKLGATYGISAALQAVDFNTRVLAMRTAVANDKASAVVAAIREEYARLLTGGLAETELDPIKRAYVTGHRDRLSRGPALAASLLSFALHDYPDDYLATYEPRLQGYGRPEVEAAMRAAFPAPPLTVAVVAPSAEGFAADCVLKSLDDLARCE